MRRYGYRRRPRVEIGSVNRRGNSQCMADTPCLSFPKPRSDDTAFETFAESICPIGNNHFFAPSMARNASPRSVGAQTKRARSSRKSGTPTGIFCYRLQAPASIASPFRQAAAVPCFPVAASKKCPRRYEQNCKRKQRLTRRAALSRPMEVCVGQIQIQYGHRTVEGFSCI